jgi:DNA-binding response OmpR family regulator/tetratricopeptide (TPR) repeat protein
VGLRILIVEDDKHIRRILESLLQHDAHIVARGCEIVVAEDGKDGLDALDKGKYDLVISDLLMPRMDGFTFCRELRKHKNGKTVPLIVTSAIYKDPATLSRLHAETGAEFFSKPFQVRELMAAVKRLLGEAERPATRPAVSGPAKEPAKAGAALPTNGDLATRLPPRLLLDFTEQRATGSLVLMRGKVRKEITFLHGTPVNVTSNLRTETLGHFLVARGVLDENRHRQALARAQQEHGRLGQMLIELGFIDEQRLLKELGAQMRAKIINVLRWKDGTWTFLPGQPSVDRLQTPAEAARLVFTGLQRTAHVDEIAQEMVKLSGRIGLTLRAERHREAFARVFGPTGLELLQRRPPITDVLAGSDPTPMLVQLDALLRCGMAEVEAGQAAKAGAVAKADPAALDKIVAQREPAPAPQKSLYDELFAEEPSEVRPLPQANAPEPEDEESGVMALPMGPHAAQLAAATAVAVAEAVDPKVEALRKEVLTEYLAIHGKDYYQVLGLGRDAAPEDVAAAYAERGRRFRLERFSDVDLGRDYAHLEEIHQILRQAFETLSSREQREGYDRVLQQKKAPSRAALDADLLAQEASVQLARGDATLARHKLREAVAAAPDQADYHALLGWSCFLADGGQQKGAPLPQVQRAAGLARPHLEQAFQIDPDSVDAHDYAGRIAAAAGDDPRAVTHLERVLDADPSRTDALVALESAHTRRSDWKRLERQYRKLIHRLGDKNDPERALRLWWRLAELYRTKLEDRESARVAFEIAAKLAPEDPRPREALARLHAEDPASWQKAALALRESWRIAPDDSRPGHTLLALHLDAQRWDAALATASVMVARGADEPQSLDLVRRYRPRFLQRIAVPFDAQLFDRVRHPDEDRDLSQLFAHVFAAHHPPFSLEDLGVAASDRVTPDALPEPFRRVLGYVAHLFGVPEPPVYRRNDFGAQAHVGAMEQPVLLVGPDALKAQGDADKLALGFRLGRALTFLWPGRAMAGALPSRRLKAVLLATVTLVSPGLHVDDPDEEIAFLRGQLAQVPQLAKDVSGEVERLLKGGQSTLNLSRHARGLVRTAERVGLLVCNDPITAARVVAETDVPGAADELLDFALSPEYLEAKEALGLSIAV